jgi:hypothetical protein
MHFSNSKSQVFLKGEIKMNIMIMTDLEGISGVDRIEMVSEKGTPGHRFALERLMLDVNAAIEINPWTVSANTAQGRFI